MATIDILLGTYNGSTYLDAQIQSLQRQTITDWRLLIRDDDSSDDTQARLTDWAAREPRITVLRDDLGNLGFNANFYHLLKQSQAPYVMFCDQDDCWLDQKIERTWAALRTQEALTPGLPLLAHCDSTVTDHTLHPIQARLVAPWARGEGLASALFANPVQGSTLMMNGALRQLLLRQPPQTHFDFQAALIAEATGKRVFVDEALMLYRQHPHNALGSAQKTPSNPVVSVRAPSWRDRQPSATFRIGIEGFEPIARTLHAVKDQWLPGTEKILTHHREFIRAGGSIHKLFWLSHAHYRFYRRKDYVDALLWALGWLQHPTHSTI